MCTDTSPDTTLIPPALASNIPARTGHASFKASEMTAAVNGVATLAQRRPCWPQARVRSTVAREMGISTVQLRYLLRKAAAHDTLATDTPDAPPCQG